jgi:hypothetical protein
MLIITLEFHKKMEAEEVETGFIPANETEKLPPPPSKAEARLETTFISKSEAEQLEDLSDLEAEPMEDLSDLEAEQMEVGSRVVHKQTKKCVHHHSSHLKVLVIMCWGRCYKCLAH